MKTPLVYGLYWTLVLLVVNIVFYFTGYHSDAEKFATADTIGKIAFWLVSIVFIMLGTRARRDEIPATEEFGYGRALLTGFQISLFAGISGIVTNILYTRLINPGFTEIIIQAATAKAEAKGASSAQIEQMEKMIHWMMGPITSSVFVVVLIVICGTLISLITSIFLRRPATAQPPVAA